MYVEQEQSNDLIGQPERLHEAAALIEAGDAEGARDTVRSLVDEARERTRARAIRWAAATGWRMNPGDRREVLEDGFPGLTEAQRAGILELAAIVAAEVAR